MLFEAGNGSDTVKTSSMVCKLRAIAHCKIYKNNSTTDIAHIQCSNMLNGHGSDTASSTMVCKLKAMAHGKI